MYEYWEPLKAKQIDLPMEKGGLEEKHRALQDPRNRDFCDDDNDVGDVDYHQNYNSINYDDNVLLMEKGSLQGKHRGL